MQDKYVSHIKYNPKTDDMVALMQKVEGAADVLYRVIDNCGQGREISIAKTKLEEVVMWTIKYMASL